MSNPTLQILVVIAAVLGIVIYRVITVSTFAALGWAPIRNNSQVATTATAVCINFCVIMLLNVVSVRRRRLQEKLQKYRRCWSIGLHLFMCSVSYELY